MKVTKKCTEKDIKYINKKESKKGKVLNDFLRVLAD